MNKNKIKKNFITLIPVLIVCLCAFNSTAFAQSNLKEGRNQYALYSKSGDRKQLEAARKFADDAYTTRRDTTSFKNNLLRALVYSTLSVVDSNRTLKYSEDPLSTAHRALEKLTDRQLSYESEPEINHVIRNLANGHIIRANKALAKNNLQEAYFSFRKVDSIDEKMYHVKPNLAILSEKLGYVDEAINRFEVLTNTSRSSKASYIHLLADLYDKKGNTNQVIKTLERGFEYYPENASILFRLINTFKKENLHEAIVPLLDQAFKLDPKNIALYEIGAYAYESTGNIEKAKFCYEQMIAIDKNSYNGNFGVGLIYLEKYIQNPKNSTNQQNAQEYLLRANQINPTGINALKSLAIFYQTKGDYLQLERVNNILDQLTLN
jgi:tetratricopeptide (TPR) repeat protein